VIGVDVREPSSAVDGFVKMDLSDPAAIDRGVSGLPGEVSGLFNCAGISGSNPARHVFAVNFLGTRHLTESLLPRLAEGGSVASVASLGGARWTENLAPVLEMLETTGFSAGLAWIDSHPEQMTPSGYNFAKQCLIAYTSRKAWELGPIGRRCNCVSPSPVDTPMLANSSVSVGQSYLDRFPRPLGRNALPVEVARPLVFLNSGAASYINGQNIYVDGGFMAGIGIGVLDRNLIAGVPGVPRQEPAG
jgi:NAD(P)-dependent dehydrogenase (short-subunit alcohol dehydrogenase family)